MKRIAIVLDKNLNSGEVGNVSAILMGHLATRNSEIFSLESLHDKNNIPHATINFSTVVLKCGNLSLINFTKNLADRSDVCCVVFSRTGQELNNEYQRYKDRIEASALEDTTPIGVGIYGDENEVKQLTKKFSLLK